jgi:hypothetical protein
MKASAKVSTDGFAGKAPVMIGNSKGRVSSTITMDLLPVVISLAGALRFAGLDGSRVASGRIVEY